MKIPLQWKTNNSRRTAIRTDGRTDIYYKANVNFRNFANAANEFQEQETYGIFYGEG
jgi:hypothetical protein